MKTQSLWQHTLTFFPQFHTVLQEQIAEGAVVVVGASDGKFVLPLVASGYHVIAIERDPVAIHGGDVVLPGGTTTHAPGLLARLKAEGLEDRVDIMEEDFLNIDSLQGVADAVWTSCSWHYSVNHRRPLGDFVGRMQDCLRPRGLFGAEFMMPIDQRHNVLEHYTSPERLIRHNFYAWNIALTLRTGVFTERAHVGQPNDHEHRMGFLLATHQPETV
ncbi:class I SAM-dependent methyltransferase [Streptantibioticus ferralitis]|uniref:Class I SAM-dependent methyltransferase n=1 Tax=Streptantibioticus ferralitis TaxID=236510 RepID=A0ABT5YS13_9ACTN|nr:class I SAM-dependent methyltransferase [Streptantibioticus ferralitis]MDF2254392.1 class I SAM-dependent methyltransferase [Streptantibioticus ferralitis]